MKALMIYPYFFDQSDKKRGKSSSREKARTWTVSFFCFSDKDSNKLPSPSERILLQKSDLGLKKITLLTTDTEEDVIVKIKETFLKLRDIGGFELLYCSNNCRKLEILQSKYSVSELKKTLGSQSKIYVRPIQKNIFTEEVEESECEVRETCMNCNTDFNILDLRKHLEECKPDILPEVSDEELEKNQMELTATEDKEPISLDDDLVQVEEQLTETEETLEEVIQRCVDYVYENNITDPVEILKVIQSKIVTGRDLELKSDDETITGLTNLILVDRYNLIETAFEELSQVIHPRLTLEVQFYGEAAVDMGGPRKEFFSLILNRIKEQYFEPVREWSKDYEMIGKIFALSTLQNGKLPRMMEPQLVEELFNSPNPRSFVSDLRTGLDWLGIYQLTRKIPSLIHLFTPTTSGPISLKLLINILNPKFSDKGSNYRPSESRVYTKFLKYLREVASGRRGNLNLGNVLQFITGAEEEPIIGFQLSPSICFRNSPSPIPTSNTCINQLTLTYDSTNDSPVNEEQQFQWFDYAFGNSFFGVM